MLCHLCWLSCMLIVVSQPFTLNGAIPSVVMLSVLVPIFHTFNSNFDPPPKQVKEMGHEEENNLFFSSLLFQFLNRKSMFAVLHSDINSLKSGLLHLTSQPYCKKSRSPKVKDGIINLILRNCLFDQYQSLLYYNISILV